MADIDFGLACEFVDPSDGVPRQLRFRQNYALPGHPRIFDGTGQLVATVADGHRADDGIDRHINLAAIRCRIHAAGLD